MCYDLKVLSKFDAILIFGEDDLQATAISIYENRYTIYGS